MTGLHTWHTNTFGLLFGATTKTACERRVPTAEIVKPLEAQCPGCQDAVINEMLLQQELYLAVREMLKEASDAWQATHPPVDGDDRSPLEVLDAGLITPREFWQMVYEP